MIGHKNSSRLTTQTKEENIKEQATGLHQCPACPGNKGTGRH